MKLKTKDIPKIKDLTLTSEEWHKSANMYTRMMVYNKKEVVIIKPPTGGIVEQYVTKEYFDKSIGEIKDILKQMSFAIANNAKAIKSLETKVDANTKAIKSVQIDLNNIVEKNNLKR